MIVRPLRRLAAPVVIVAQLARLLASTGRLWMLPMVVVLALSSLLLVLVAAVEYVGPFVYTLF